MTLPQPEDVRMWLSQDGYNFKGKVFPELAIAFMNAELLATISTNTRHLFEEIKRMNSKIAQIEKHTRKEKVK